MYISENDMGWIDKTVDMLIKGKLKPKQYDTGRDVVSLLDIFGDPINLKEGLEREDIDGYKCGVKIQLIKHFVREAWIKFMPMFEAAILNHKWEQTWYDFVVTQLSIFY